MTLNSVNIELVRAKKISKIQSLKRFFFLKKWTELNSFLSQTKISVFDIIFFYYIKFVSHNIHNSRLVSLLLSAEADDDGDDETEQEKKKEKLRNNNSRTTHNKEQNRRDKNSLSITSNTMFYSSLFFIFFPPLRCCEVENCSSKDIFSSEPHNLIQIFTQAFIH